MCGIGGILDTNATHSGQERLRLLTKMMRAIRHRGPDDFGVWEDAAVGIALGHRRLSIVDLSMSGHQPMASVCGRYVTSFNGEIYNFPSLREDLEIRGHRFRGQSDTEVMLAAFSEWGIEATVRRLNGMFAIALWDRETRRLHLVRDRMGEKPIYYGWIGKSFVFGSELKAIRAHPQFHGTIDRGAVGLFMRHNYIPAPSSIYEGIFKVPPGTIVTITPGAGGAPEVHTYWSVAVAAEQGRAKPFAGTLNQAIACLDELLRDAIKLRMVADVPLGAFLSGGVDSSTIVALMQAQSSAPIRTFSIGFHEPAYNEAPFAKAVAEHLGTDHTEVYVSPSQAMEVIPKLPTIYDEPFSDSSQIPTYLISQLTKSKVTVALSGDGGDELFGGYDRYFHVASLWRTVQSLPLPLRRHAARSLVRVPSQAWSVLGGIAGAMYPKWGRNRKPAEICQHLVDLLAAQSLEHLYQGAVSHWKHPSEVVVGLTEPATMLTDRACWSRSPDPFDRMTFLDLQTYLPDDILVKVDRASMAVSLEARVPFLDHRLVEFACQLSTDMKVRQGRGKYLLRQVLHRYVPQSLIDRPKMGFGIPIDVWLRGPLREWAEALLDEKRLRDQGFFHAEVIMDKWREHLSGMCNWQYHLWDVLMFQCWFEQERHYASE